RSAHRAVASDHGDTGGGPGSKEDQAAPRGRIGITQSSHPPPPGTFSKLIRTVESLHLTKNEPERRAPGAVRLRRGFAATGRFPDTSAPGAGERTGPVSTRAATPAAPHPAPTASATPRYAVAFGRSPPDKPRRTSRTVTPKAHSGS